MKATIYIPDDKYKVYEDARQKLGDSISAIFLRCLERELAQHKQTVGRIVVTINDNGTPCKKAFEGRWIWGSADEGQKVDLLADDKGGHYNVFGYSVAVTKARRVVVLRGARMRVDIVNAAAEGRLEKRSPRRAPFGEQTRIGQGRVRLIGTEVPFIGGQECVWLAGIPR